jgi:hypothetical protein
VEHSGDMAMEIGQFSTMARQADAMKVHEGAGTREVGERMAEVWGVGLIRADGWNRTHWMWRAIARLNVVGTGLWI